jgi:hypothetical protein
MADALVGWRHKLEILLRPRSLEVNAFLFSNRTFQNRKSGWSTRSFFWFDKWSNDKWVKWQNSHGARFAKTTANCSNSFCHFHLILSVSRPLIFISTARKVKTQFNNYWMRLSMIYTERVKRRASKCIHKLPFMCTESYKDRLMSINLLPVSYWHEYLHLMFFFKAINGIITVPKEILPKRSIPSRPTRSSSNNSVISYRPRRCKIATYINGHFLLEQLEPGTPYPNT